MEIYSPLANVMYIKINSSWSNNNRLYCYNVDIVYATMLCYSTQSPSNKSEEFPQILQPWWLSLRNFRGIFWESFPVTESLEILENFPRIGPQDERFLWDQSFETQFREIPGNFSGISPQDIPEKFSELHHRVFKFRFSPIGVSVVLFFYALP